MALPGGMSRYNRCIVAEEGNHCVAIQYIQGYNTTLRALRHGVRALRHGVRALRHGVRALRHAPQHAQHGARKELGLQYNFCIMTEGRDTALRHGVPALMYAQRHGPALATTRRPTCGLGVVRTQWVHSWILGVHPVHPT